MIRYIPHRGSLSASMKEETKYRNIEDMKEALACKYYDKEDIVVKDESSYDKRIGYTTSMVCVKRFADQDYMKLYNCPQCIGFVEVKDE